jgi:hypothetical protein
METMMEPMHPRRLEKKANIRSNRRWGSIWPDPFQEAMTIRSHVKRSSNASRTVTKDPGLNLAAVVSADIPSGERYGNCVLDPLSVPHPIPEASYQRLVRKHWNLP